MPGPEQREILIEFTKYGSSLRVTAVDTDTGTEITFQAPSKTTRAAIERLAISKMRYVLRKKGG